MVRATHRLLVASVLALVLCGASGCTFKFHDYQPVSRQLTAARPAVRVAIDNPEASFKVEGFYGDAKPKESSPPVAEYLRGALHKELVAAGFRVVTKGPHDVLLRLRVRNLIFAQVIPFWVYPLPIAYAKQAGIADVMATAKLKKGGRVFQRRIAQVANDKWFWFFLPIGKQSGAELVQDATQRCLSELVAAVAELLRNPDGQG